MTKLSVNVNKLATLRNSRGKNNPDVLKTALDIVKFGAQGITVHPRPDERHIRRDDVLELAKHLSVEFNIEGYPSSDFMKLIEAVKPAQCTLVPDPPHVLTSNAGWKVKENIRLISEVADHLNQLKVRSSFFVEPGRITREEMEMLAKAKVQRVELYTESYAEHYALGKQGQAIEIYKEVAAWASALNIGINAGHDLNQQNLRFFMQNIPQTLEVSIGHALICDALYGGFERTIKSYLACLR